MNTQPEKTLISEDELIGMLAVLKRQQTQLEALHNVVQSATGGLAQDRTKIMGDLYKALDEIRKVPDEAMQTLTKAAETAAGDGIRKSFGPARKTLTEAVNQAVDRVNEIHGESLKPALIGAIIGSVVGGLAVAGLMSWAILSGKITLQINLDAAEVAKYLQPSIQQSKPQ